MHIIYALFKSHHKWVIIVITLVQCKSEWSEAHLKVIFIQSLLWWIGYKYAIINSKTIAVISHNTVQQDLF